MIFTLSSVLCDIEGNLDLENLFRNALKYDIISLVKNSSLRCNFNVQNRYTIAWYNFSYNQTQYKSNHY